MLNGTTIRSKRVAAEIPAELVALRAGMDRARLSRIERGLTAAPAAELEKVNLAIDNLAVSKRLIRAYAASLGWPGAVRE